MSASRAERNGDLLSGDEEAYTALYTRMAGRIYGHACNMLGDTDDAQEVTAETFTRLARAIQERRLRPDTRIDAWLFTVAGNACFDVFRKRRTRRHLPWDPERHDELLLSRRTETPEGSLESTETVRRVRATLLKLPPKHRQALLLRECDALSVAEIGSVLHMTESGVKSLLHRAREEFRRHYGAA